MASQARVQSGKGDGTDPIAVINVSMNGGEPQQVVVDARTLTGMDRRRMKVELAKLGYEPDGTDVLYATIWVVMRRDDDTITFDEVCEAITYKQLQDAEHLAADVQDITDPN